MRPTAYRRNAPGLRDRQAFKGVRMQAGALFAAGHAQAEVARHLGGARQNLSRRHARWRTVGLNALTGQATRLSDAQLAAIDQALRHGGRRPRLRHRPLDPGPDHHRDPAADRGRLPSRPRQEAAEPRRHDRPQRPAAGRSSAISRPSPARWPRISRRICRNPRRRRAEVVFWDESGASLLPVVRRTWTPQGHTPVIGHRFNWKRASMAAALCYGARGGGAAPPSTTRSTPTTPRP